RQALQKIAFSKPKKIAPPFGYARLNEIIFKCMADIDNRYQAMSDVVNDLREFKARMEQGTLGT
ncbi:MAG TPA: hypothetical protein VF335_00445, partial [Chitinivibrionales bacterium]